MNRTKHLLSADLGVKTGMALFSSEPRLIWYRSQNYGNKNRLKTDVHNILKDFSPSDIILVEGGGELLKIWKNEAVKKRMEFIQVYAEDWREDLLFKRQFKDGLSAKKHATNLAMKVVNLYSQKKPLPMIHDAAEAILAGLWGIHTKGWISGFPEFILKESR